MKLRSYQSDLAEQIISAPRGLNVLAQADTGAGKTSVLADVASRSEYAIVVAHRNILIRQASATLARHGVRHGAVCSEHTRRLCLLEHRRALGKEMLRVKGRIRKFVSSVDRLLSLHRRGLLTLDRDAPWDILVDEAHHMLDGNKWGRLLEIFPNARIVGFTATPCRADGQSLARGKGGVFDMLLQAEELLDDSVRKLISRGFLSDFKIYSVSPPDEFDERALVVGRDGDYTQQSLLGVFDGAAYVFAGSAVKHYKRLAHGKQAVVFCVGIGIAEVTARTFRTAGFSAACISSNMTPADVARVFDMFRMRQVQVICHVDMLGEGVDVPAIEALIMLRKTASLANYRQWIGRALRPEPGKPHAVIIDHVGNVLTHGMPDEHIAWSLLNPPAAKKSNLFSCQECDFAYKAWLSACPECGCANPIWERRGGTAQLENVRYLDVDLVERERRSVEAAEKEALYNAEIRLPSRDYGSGAIGAAVVRLQSWFAESARQKAGIQEVNDFFRSDKVCRPGWWIDRFTLADIKKNNAAKAVREFRKWQASR